MADAIEVRGLTKVYKGFRTEDLEAVKGIDFKVGEGDIFGFLGPNGAGKTTTIRILATIMPPTSGSAKICGYDIMTEPNRVKACIGLMPESPGYYGDMKARDTLEYYASFYRLGGEERRRKVAKLLEIVGLNDFADKRIKSFSHGMRKRLSLAQALLNDPKLLILDEPTGGLDPEGRYSFRKMIKELNELGLTIFLSSHILPEVQEMCNRICILNKGKIVALDTIENISKMSSLTSMVKLEVYVEGEGLTIEVANDATKDLGLKGWRPSGGGYIFDVGDGQTTSYNINRYLIDNDVRVASVHSYEPTLEDVFLSLTKATPSMKKTHKKAEKVVWKKVGGEK